jgi:hypothetical protein
VNQSARATPDDPLSGLLAALSDEGRRLASTARAGIMEEFATAILYARRCPRTEEWPESTQTLKEAWRSALAADCGKAALEGKVGGEPLSKGRFTS